MNRSAVAAAENILVLQGGGALGSYQAGVFEALDGDGIELTWVTGISIGAINSALIAGNPKEKRLDRLREFWNLVSSSLPEPLRAIQAIDRTLINDISATQVMMFGVPGFFTPWMPPPPFNWKGTPAAISYYDTRPLQSTLERLVDFDRINYGGVRLSVGAVNVHTGNFVYFDTTRHRIDARHIMASGALPPGFPSVEIDGEHYWDGGLVSNTPLQYVLDQPSGRSRTVFQVDLFPARGSLPATMNQVGEREKDIRYSSRTRMNTTLGLERRDMAQAARRLLDKMPVKLREDKDAQALAQWSPTCEGLDVVHLIYRTKLYEHHSKDYEFSRLTMREHWSSGKHDMQRTLSDPRWKQRGPSDGSVRVFDVTATEPKKEPT
ncbi:MULTISPECIES: DUF3734 domain-containing protein [Burkholderia cepacia complex]|uniref:DUF3734 domain-containing protein n=1 Tax=Burkholderia cepacia complex TaxID=87882 RepID=UPI001CF27C03|nr:MULTISPECIES: patatin-like phospholipase family protein [Burkholderia cepacia complex]MCA8057339.1 patatin-like phospholipase family protein [Burkholderia cepacia]MDN7531324.1 patatin-like phospholipase family protein [Burkholderia orbicola]